MSVSGFATPPENFPQTPTTRSWRGAPGFSRGEDVNKQSAQIQSLAKQLNTTLQQAQDLAVKALEGSANASSFAAMKEIALEQAKTAQKAK